MGMIPELKTAFCGSSLRAGTKIVGWVTLILGILEFLLFAIAIGLLAATVSNIEDEKLGNDAIKMLQKQNGRDQMFILDAENKEQMQGAEVFQGLLVMLVGDGSDTSEPAVVGKRLKDQLQSIFTVVFIAVLVLFLVHTLFAALLLIGAYKNKSGYILFYIVMSVLGLLGYLPLIFNGYASFNAKISTLIACLVHVYFTWVIYSFYRELRRNRFSAQNMPMIVPGQKIPYEADERVPVPNDNFNSYYYPHK